jgi:hypothetical protein
MEGRLKKIWPRLIAIIYLLSATCLVVAACVTAYALDRPELGLSEETEITRSNIAEFGLTLGILITVLQGLFFLVLAPCVVLVTYWYLANRKNKGFTRWGPLIYSGILAWGMSLLVLWFVDATNDVSWVFFHGSPTWVVLFLNFSAVMFLLLFGVFFLLVLSAYYLIVRKRPFFPHNP